MADVLRLNSETKIFGIAGGGGSSSDYSGSSSSSGSSYSSFDSDWESNSYGSSDSSLKIPAEFAPIVISACIIIPAILCVYVWKKAKKDEKRNRSKSTQSTQAKTQLNQINKPLYDLPVKPRRPEDLESKENIAILKEKAKNIFSSYQQDWTDFNISGMKQYQTQKYYTHACLMLELLKSMHRQNIVSDIVIRNIDIDANRLYKTDTTFLATIHFSCTDELYDTKTNRRLTYDKLTNYEETWEFVRDNENNIKLNAIYQSAMMSFSHLVKDMQEFASANHLYYSADWGLYALPDRGSIFDKTSLKYADVNNHVIGKWNDTLVQLYTYSRTPAEPGSYWLVGSLTVPKIYDGIIVRHLRATGCIIPKGYQQYQMEWEEFNQIFEVWASDIDKITSFELVNPKFMAYLVDNELNFSLEVIGNHIYFFAHAGQFDKSNYEILLNILAEAYRELKM